MTRRLVASAAHYWPHLDGGSDLDPMDLPIDRFLNRAYWFLIKDVAHDPRAVERVDARLWMPPPGVVPTQGPWTAEAETAALGALQAEVNATPPNSGA